MKKYFAFLLVICLLYSLSGCNMNPGPDNNLDPSTESSGSPSTDPSDPTSSGSTVSQAPMVSVSVPVVTDPTLATDGTVVFNYTYQNISLIHPDPDVADKVIVDFLNRIDSFSSSASDIEAAALSNYNGTGSWNPYLCLTAYDPVRVDQGVLSLFGTHATYSGTLHPETEYVSVNYDLVSGEVLDLTDILAKTASADTLYKYVTDALSRLAEEKSLRSNYRELVKPYFSGNLDRSTDWYFSQNGLCFFFQPYELAPYASGVIIAEIPYDLLAGTLDDAYFPAERDTASGTVYVQSFDNAEQSKFTQFADLVLDENGDNILLYTDSSVHSVFIEVGEWSASGAYYTAQHTIFAASGLTPGDAILVETALETSLPTLRLSYQSGTEIHFFYIAKGADNRIQLIPC